MAFRPIMDACESWPTIVQRGLEGDFVILSPKKRESAAPWQLHVSVSHSDITHNSITRPERSKMKKPTKQFTHVVQTNEIIKNEEPMLL